VPTANPVSVPTNKDGSGHVVLALNFSKILRSFL
jgi:hypothetical protein